MTRCVSSQSQSSRSLLCESKCRLPVASAVTHDGAERTKTDSVRYQLVEQQSNVRGGPVLPGLWEQAVGALKRWPH